MLDEFKVGDKHVQVAEFPELISRYGLRYHFYVLNPDGKMAYRISLESDEFDKASLGQRTLPGSGGRQTRVSLDSYWTNTHAIHRFYDSEPSYDDVRAEVTKIVEGKMKASVPPQAA